MIYVQVFNLARLDTVCGIKPALMNSNMRFLTYVDGEIYVFVGKECMFERSWAKGEGKEASSPT
jgi:hypothetical protein